MEGSKMSKAEYDLKGIMYSVYDTPHKLCSWKFDQKCNCFKHITCNENYYHRTPGGKILTQEPRKPS